MDDGLRGSITVAGIIAFAGFFWMWGATMIDMGGRRQLMRTIIDDAKMAVVYAAFAAMSAFLVIAVHS